MELLPGHYTLCSCAIKARERSFVGDRREQSAHLLFHCNYCFCPERHTDWSIERGYCSSAVLFVCWPQAPSDVEVISDYLNLTRIWVKSTPRAPNLPTARPKLNLHVQFPSMTNTFHSLPAQQSGFNKLKRYFSLSSWATISQPRSKHRAFSYLATLMKDLYAYV